LSASGRTFGGRYAVIERVGAGGMAEVYRARDELLGRDVAVKVLSERFARDTSFVERFRREAQAAANLSHPNIVSLYDYGSDGETYFIVMEFIDGRGLDEIIRDEGPLLPERAAEIASDVAKALERAHTAGLVHRDVKPSNIMITSQGQTKVTDFGIVRALGGDGENTMTQTGMVIGTAAYLSPEQAQGNPVDARSDVYSLGCVLYEMLTGRAPFTGETPLAIAYKHVREDPQPPSALNPDATASLDAIVMKALAKNPDNRYSSAKEMREDLERFLAGQAVRATPLLAEETRVVPAATGTQMMQSADDDYYDEPARGRGWLFALIALVILALVAGLAYLLAQNLLGKDVTVPDVVGLQVDEAQTKLENRGLESQIENKQSNKPEGEVLEQDPPGGETAKEGDTVTLVVSGGARQIEVPNVVGSTVDEATQAIEDAKLTVGEITEQPDAEAPEGEVIKQFPAAGRQVDARSKVDLVVSSGPQPVIVPSVIGQTEEDARATLEAEGLEVDVATQASDEEQGTVIDQDPSAGTEVSPGDTVRILVSEGPQEQPMPDVTGQDADDAQAFLEDNYGLTVTQTDADPADCGAQPPGTVCSTDPPPDTPVSPGDSATLFVMPGEAGIPFDALFAAFSHWLG
jgi:serine/threonine-protein kinase